MSASYKWEQWTGPGGLRWGLDREQHEVILLLLWTAREGMKKVTADMTNSTKGLLGTQYRNSKQRQTQFCQRVNKEKHFTDSKFKGSKRL